MYVLLMSHLVVKVPKHGLTRPSNHYRHECLADQKLLHGIPQQLVIEPIILEMLADNLLCSIFVLLVRTSHLLTVLPLHL